MNDQTLAEQVLQRNIYLRCFLNPDGSTWTLGTFRTSMHPDVLRDILDYIGYQDRARQAKAIRFTQVYLRFMAR